MDNELPQYISKISEIPVLVKESPVIHFGAALLWGALTGAVSVVVPLAISTPENAAVTLFAGLYFMTIGASLFTLIGMLAIGLPVTVLLKFARAEHRYLYAGIGFVAGAGFQAILLGVSWRYEPEAVIFLVAGGLAGFAAALRWGRWREALARYRQRLAEQEARTEKRSNPIHDLIH